jgi:hypothetical protein
MSCLPERRSNAAVVMVLTMVLALTQSASVQAIYCPPCYNNQPPLNGHGTIDEVA